MKLSILLIVFVLASCGGGTDPCAQPNWRDVPQCVPPVPLPCTYPCTESNDKAGG